MSYATPYDKPDVAFLRMTHCRTLSRAFERVNAPVRDWHYWCDLDRWDIGKWIDSVLRDATAIEEKIQNPEVTELTEKAIRIFSQARTEHVDPAEFNALVQRLAEVLK